jgi:hypothetical protein
VSSVAEADDLPVLAPALYGAPVIASDLASLRRAGGVEVYLFPIGSASSLAALIRATRRSVATASSVEARTWDDCIMELTNCLSPHR